MKPTLHYSLSKYLSHAGVCSRRKATDFIISGVVKVNNVIITEPGYKVQKKDTISVNGIVISLEKKVYILLNKPTGCVTTVSDPQNRKTVLDVIGSIDTRLYPVGRLDYNTTGLLLLTNDGDLAQMLAHPKYEITKEYMVTLNRPLTQNDMQKIIQGVMLEDGKIVVDAIYYVQKSNKKKVIIVIHSGRYRVIRRLFKTLQYHVKKLDRISYAGLMKKGLRVGTWRYITDDEVKKLKQ